ncbi:MAG: phage tail protein [Kiritimatiellia bacterium]
MSHPTFDYNPDFGAGKDVEPRVNRIKFGDGYEQRQASGLNTLPSTWALSFQNRETDLIDEIEEFLKEQGGVEYFYWTPPDEDTALKWICAKWSATKPVAGMRSLVCNFEQVFDL